MKNTHNVGKAGELAVASQLLLRDIPVHVPFVDTGTDLIAGTTVRIQVKSSRTRTRQTGGYHFTLASRVLPSRKIEYRLKERDWSKDCDFLVFWGADENRFWVVPSRVFAGSKQQCIIAASDGTRKRVDHDRIRELYATGMNQSQIAKEMGLSTMCVSECIRGKTKGAYPATLDIRSYENAWHEIEAAVKLANEIDDIDSLLSASEIEHITRHFEETPATALQE